MNVSEIKEWHIELRDNEVTMGEENVKAKKKKLDHEEQSMEEQVYCTVYTSGSPENCFIFPLSSWPRRRRSRRRERRSWQNRRRRWLRQETTSGD